MLLPSENPFKCHEEALYLQPMIPPKRFDIFPPDWGILRRSGRVQIFSFKNHRQVGTVAKKNQLVLKMPGLRLRLRYASLYYY